MTKYVKLLPRDWLISVICVHKQLHISPFPVDGECLYIAIWFKGFEKKGAVKRKTRVSREVCCITARGGTLRLSHTPSVCGRLGTRIMAASHEQFALGTVTEARVQRRFLEVYPRWADRNFGHTATCEPIELWRHSESLVRKRLRDLMAQFPASGFLQSGFLECFILLLLHLLRSHSGDLLLITMAWPDLVVSFR